MHFVDLEYHFDMPQNQSTSLIVRVFINQLHPSDVKIVAVL